MEFLGHGIDLVSLSRLARLLEGVHVPSDWLTGDEIALAPQDTLERLAFYGGRIAAKEAVAKALGVGFAGEVTWADVEILRAKEGAPDIRLHGALLAIASAAGVDGWSVSISHTEELAVASAVALGFRSGL